MSSKTFVLEGTHGRIYDAATNRTHLFHTIVSLHFWDEGGIDLEWAPMVDIYHSSIMAEDIAKATFISAYSSLLLPVTVFFVEADGVLI